MAAVGALRRSSGILRSFCSLAPSAYHGTCSISSISRLSLFHISHGQGSAVSFTRPLLSFGSTCFGHPVSIVNSVTPLLPSIFHQQTRTLIKFSLRKGKRKTVKAVVYRFLRLHSGLWLRRKAGYKKRLWKKMLGEDSV